MKRIRDLIAGDTTAGNMLKLGGGTALGQLFSVLVLPIISRQYDPIQRGFFGIFSAFVATATVVVGLRFEMAVPTANSDKEADQLLTLSLLTGVVISTLAGLAFYALHLLNIGGYGELAGWSSWLLVLTLILTGAFSSLRFWFVRRADFGGISKAMIQQGFVRAVVPVFLGLLKFDWIGLAIGEVFGRVSGVFSLSKRALSGVRESLGDRAGLMSTAYKYRSMPLQMMPSSLIDSLASSIPIPLFFSYYGGVNAGLSSMALMTIAIPSGLIAASVADVFHQQLADLLREDPSKISHYLIIAGKKMLKISVCIYVPFAALGYFLAEPLLGQKWAPVSWMLVALTPMVVGSSLCSPLSRTLVVVNRVDWKIYVDFATLALGVLPILGCAYFNLSFEVCFALFSLTKFASRLLYAWVIWRASLSQNHRLPEGLR
jgi:O-antigen/teichoic acid export membrane protein